MKVLVIEDDAETAAYILRGLHEHGHVADHVADGQDGLLMAVSGVHDVLVVDRMLPGLDGLGLVRILRGAGVKAPVLFLTALRGVGDRVQGLEGTVNLAEFAMEFRTYPTRRRAASTLQDSSSATVRPNISGAGSRTAQVDDAPAAASTLSNSHLVATRW